MTQSSSQNATQINRKRVVVKLISTADYPTQHAKKKDHVVAVTTNFAEAFALTTQAQSLEPIQKNNKWRIPGLPGFKSKSCRFWKLVGGERKAYSAPVGGAPMYAVIKAAKKLAGCIGVTSPAGVSYWFTSSAGGSQSGGGS